jgi:hypothetical protein
MALNMNNMQQPTGNTLGFPAVGPHVSRLIGVVDLGKQDRQPYKGEEKTPCGQLVITFELTDDFVEIEGVKKPRWISKRLNAFSGQNSSLTALVASLDPANMYNGDLAAMVNASLPCLVTIAQKTDAQTKQPIEGVRISQISALPPGFAAPPAVNIPLVFDWETPDMGAFDRLPAWIKEQIGQAHDFKGSKIEPLVTAYNAQKAQQQAQTAQQAQSQPAPAAQPAPSVQPAQATPAPAQAAPQAAQTGVPSAPPGYRFDTATNSFVPDTAPAPVQAPAKVQVTMGPDGWAQDASGQWVKFDPTLHEVATAQANTPAPQVAQGAPAGGRPY